nr:MAG TPA: hypothetical protein [Caudoviricetes sp.]
MMNTIPPRNYLVVYLPNLHIMLLVQLILY